MRAADEDQDPIVADIDEHRLVVGNRVRAHVPVDDLNEGVGRGDAPAGLLEGHLAGNRSRRHRTRTDLERALVGDNAAARGLQRLPREPLVVEGRDLPELSRR